MSERIQSQFLNVIDRDEAERRFHEALDLSTVAQEQVELGDALGRILAQNIVDASNVPSENSSDYAGLELHEAHA